MVADPSPATPRPYLKPDFTIHVLTHDAADLRRNSVYFGSVVGSSLLAASMLVSSMLRSVSGDTESVTEKKKESTKESKAELTTESEIEFGFERPPDQHLPFQPAPERALPSQAPSADDLSRADKPGGTITVLQDRAGLLVGRELVANLPKDLKADVIGKIDNWFAIEVPEGVAVRAPSIFHLNDGRVLKGVIVHKDGAGYKIEMYVGAGKMSATVKSWEVKRIEQTDSHQVGWVHWSAVKYRFSATGAWISEPYSPLSGRYGDSVSFLSPHEDGSPAFHESGAVLRAEFEKPVDAVQVRAIPLSRDCYPYLVALDSQGAVLGQVYHTAPTSRGEPVDLRVEAKGIAAARFSAKKSGNSVLFDQLVLQRDEGKYRRLFGTTSGKDPDGGELADGAVVGETFRPWGLRLSVEGDAAKAVRLRKLPEAAATKPPDGDVPDARTQREQRVKVSAQKGKLLSGGRVVAWVDTGIVLKVVARWGDWFHVLYVAKEGGREATAWIHWSDVLLEHRLETAAFDLPTPRYQTAYRNTYQLQYYWAYYWVYYVTYRTVPRYVPQYYTTYRTYTTYAQRYYTSYYTVYYTVYYWY